MKIEMTDLRAVNWNELRDKLNPSRKKVHDGFHNFGPATAVEMAAKLGMDKCSTRPRVTELYHLGLLVPTGIRRQHQHEFAWCSMQAAEAKRRTGQAELALKP